MKKTISRSKKVPDVLIQKINQFIDLYKIDNPISQDPKVQKRTMVTVTSSILTRNGYQAASQYINGKIYFEKQRLKYKDLLIKFNEYRNEILEIFPMATNDFTGTVWNTTLNYAMIKGEKLAIEFLERVKDKNIETLTPSNEEE